MILTTLSGHHLDRSASAWSNGLLEVADKCAMKGIQELWQLTEAKYTAIAPSNAVHSFYLGLLLYNFFGGKTST